MGSRNHGADPDRAHEQSSSSSNRREQGPAPTTFGPGFAFYALPPVFLVGGGGLLSIELRAPKFDILHVSLAMGLMLVALLFPFGAWTRYRLDEDGIERRRLGSRRHWLWDEIGGVRGVELSQTIDKEWRDSGRYAGSQIRRIVFDAEGRTLFRISPWTTNRRQLATLIRRLSTG